MYQFPTCVVFIYSNINPNFIMVLMLILGTKSAKSLFKKFPFINIFHMQYVQIHLHASLSTFPGSRSQQIELQLLSSKFRILCYDGWYDDNMNLAVLSHFLSACYHNLEIFQVFLNCYWEPLGHFFKLGHDHCLCNSPVTVILPFDTNLCR
jgi:hypothetical protein